MESEKMRGMFEYRGKEYPFVLEKQILLIPQVPFQYAKDFKEITYIEAIQGVTYNNRSVIFIGCKVINSDRLRFAMEIKMSILGYVVSENNSTVFERLDFYSEGINGFYSPRNAYEVECIDFANVRGIKIRDVGAYKKDFACKRLTIGALSPSQTL